MSEKFQPIPFQTLTRATVGVSIGSLMVILIYTLTGALSSMLGFYAMVAILVSTAFFIRPFIVNIESLTKYVDDLSQDKKVDAPDLSLLGSVGSLSNAVVKLHRSWGIKKQQMDAALAEREILVDTIPDILFMLDEKGHIIQSNGSARHRFGQKLAGNRFTHIIPSHTLANAIEEVKKSFRGRDVEIFLEYPDETFYRAHIERFPVHSPGGIAFIVTLHDITELKHIEQMRADFVANASHEIRTPLASLIGFIETLQGPARNDPEASEQFLKIMAEQANRMSQLVNDLLSLSKLEMNAQSIPMGSVDIMAVIHKVKHNVAWMIKDKNITIKLSLPESLPPVRGETTEIYQVLENLVGNSIKYGRDDGTITVSALLTHKPPNDPNFQRTHHAIAVSVQDESEGIPKSHISRLTERFYRVTNSKSKKVSGTGLGLAIVKHILTRHQGVLTIDSQLGKGSTFTIYLHVRQQEIPLA